MGTELDARGVDTTLPLWSARALVEAPEIVEAIHREYVAAGATVHTANTFRTKRRTLRATGIAWAPLARLAVQIARAATPSEHRVAGSIAPLEDCYRPDLSPSDSRGEHRELAEVLADAGCDLLLCETFPHVGEALVAVEEAVRTGVETWVAFTAGPDAGLLTPRAVAEGARASLGAGATAVLINCTPAIDVQPYVEALVPLGAAVGAYANAGRVDDGIGWKSSAEPGAIRYAALAERWRAAGATIVGGCCGTTPAHVRALAERFSSLGGQASGGQL